MKTLESRLGNGAWGLLLLETFLESWCSIAQVIGEGNGTPLQYSCLENPMDGGAW